MSTIIHHYTNIEALALILRNRTLRFNRLDQVDDPEESTFISNVVNLGIYTFVSCWTEAKEESIPMWKMYTNGKWGVRLSVEKLGLFKTYCANSALNVPSGAFSNVPSVTDSNVPLQMWLL